MPNTYKVWIEVEEIDEENDHYETLGTPLGGEQFDTEAEAWAHAGRLASLEILDETKSIINIDAEDPLTECDNCRKQFKVSELDGYKDFWSRVEIGKEIPAGDCPDCGAFAYLVKPKIKLKVAFGETRALQRETEKVMEFDTEAEKSAYTEGLGDMDGWLNYETFDN